ncbi:PspC domain-containing protein [Pseudonocardia sp.]|uniref:PspC domain-containing protein n=1 Tax=Pseudonocardia sp. TaxID=60912 RepID=UPI003D0D6F29
MNGTDVHSTLREMWETRPARPRHDRKVAGVAAAIARRYDIDPVLVRVGFVVAAIYGIGAALYIAGWVLLPEAAEDDPTDGAAASAQPGKRPHPGLLIALVVAAVVGTGAIFGRDGGIIWPAIIALGLLFLLHRARGGRGIPGPGATSQPGPADGAPTVSLRKDGDATAQQGTTELDPVTGEPKPTPPSWDPLGAAPFAWDLPEPAPEPAPEAPAPRRRPPVTAVTLAVALVVGGVLGALLLGGAGLTSLPVLFADRPGRPGRGPGRRGVRPRRPRHHPVRADHVPADLGRDADPERRAAGRDREHRDRAGDDRHGRSRVRPGRRQHRARPAQARPVAAR